MTNLKSKKSEQKEITGQIKKKLITACRILSGEGLVQGFGHVSARLAGADRFIMTPRVGLALVREQDLIVLDFNAKKISGKGAPPSEAALHAALFRGRPDIQVIVRVHGRRANYFSVTDVRLEPVHNHGSFFSGGVPVFPKPDLITTLELGDGVLRALGNKPAVLLRGNGQVTVGRSIPEAVMMAIYLEEAADVLYGALQLGRPIFLTADESAMRQKEALPPVDLERAWNFFKSNMESKSAKGIK